MRIGLIASPEDRQWRMLFVYNLYRLVSIALIISIYWFNLKPKDSSATFLFALVPYGGVLRIEFYCHL